MAEVPRYYLVWSLPTGHPDLLLWDLATNWGNLAHRWMIVPLVEGVRGTGHVAPEPDHARVEKRILGAESENGEERKSDGVDHSRSIPVSPGVSPSTTEYETVRRRRRRLLLPPFVTCLVVAMATVAWFPPLADLALRFLHSSTPSPVCISSSPHPLESRLPILAPSSSSSSPSASGVFAGWLTTLTTSLSFATKSPLLRLVMSPLTVAVAHVSLRLPALVVEGVGEAYVHTHLEADVVSLHVRWLVGLAVGQPLLIHGAIQIIQRWWYSSVHDVGSSAPETYPPPIPPTLTAIDSSSTSSFPPFHVLVGVVLVSQTVLTVCRACLVLPHLVCLLRARDGVPKRHRDAPWRYLGWLVVGISTWFLVTGLALRTVVAQLYFPALARLLFIQYDDLDESLNHVPGLVLLRYTRARFLSWGPMVQWERWWVRVVESTLACPTRPRPSSDVGRALVGRGWEKRGLRLLGSLWAMVVSSTRSHEVDVRMAEWAWSVVVVAAVAAVAVAGGVAWVHELHFHLWRDPRRMLVTREKQY